MLVLYVRFLSICKLLLDLSSSLKRGFRRKISLRSVHALQLLFECIRILFGSVDPCLSLSLCWNSCLKIEFSCTKCILINPNVSLAGLTQTGSGPQILQVTNFFGGVQIASTG